MKTLIFQIGKHKMWVYWADHNPPHVHIVGAGCEAKIYVRTLEVIRVQGYSRAEIKGFQRVIERKREYILELWEELYGKR